MTTDIPELAQSHELLIANGQQIADLLRHLADNEIDSDYFAVVSECESYGQETDAELSITEFALRAAGYVDELVEALEKAQQRIDSQREYYDGVIADGGKRIAELEFRTVKLPSELEFRNNEVCSVCAGNALQVIEDKLTAAGIKVEAE